MKYRRLPELGIVSKTGGFTYKTLSFCLQGLLKTFPFLKSFVIGHSVLGKPIYMLAAGSGQNRVMYNAAHHANEWITSMVMTEFIGQYMTAIAQGTMICGHNALDIYKKTTIYFVPMVNPDGVDLVTGNIQAGETYESAKKMNYSNLPFPDEWKANINGVDLNLQYPADWEIAKKIKKELGYNRPGPRDFTGISPLCEPESRAMTQATDAVDPSLTLSLHTQGRIIYWRYADKLPFRSYEIACQLSDASGYPCEDTPYISGHAGYKDWFIQKYNRPGYTIECGAGENPLPLSQFGEIYRDVSKILALSAIL